MRRFSHVVAAAAVVLLAAACGSSSSGGDTGSSTAPTSDVKVGLAYDVGGRGDQSFNDSAARGLDKAKSELGITAKELEASNGEKDSAKEERLRLLAQGGYNPIIAVGFAYAAALGKVADEFPDTKFAIIDDSSLKNKNVTSLVFAEEQGSFLVGAIAANASKSGTVGFIGGVNVPLLQKFQAGFEAGAKAAKPSIKVLSKYLTEPPDFGGFNDPAKGKTTANGMLDDGADVIYAAAGGSGSGVFEAAAAKQKWAIGVDSDQYLTAAATVKQYVLTSMLKQVDVAVYDYIKADVGGTPLTGVQTFDLKAGGVGYSESNAAVKDYLTGVEDFEKKIVDGSLKVPTTP